MQSQCEQQKSQHLEESVTSKNYTIEVEPLLQATNPSGTIICGCGKLFIEVVKVPKKRHNESVDVANKNSEGTSWGTPWSAKDSSIIKDSNPDPKTSLHST